MSTDEKQDVECPTCGDEFGSRMAVGVHHSKVHGESLMEYEARTGPNSDIECPTCGKVGFQSRKGLGCHHKFKHGESILEYERRQATGGKHECPTCGRADFVSELGLQQHHARVHGESLAQETRQCTWCGDDFTRPRSEFTSSDMDFCDPDCVGAWISENQAGENNPQWNGGKVSVECANCGTVRERRPSKVERAERNYCSPECWSEHRSDVFIGENNPKYDRVTVECFTCGAEKEVIPFYFEKNERFFCGFDCRGEWWSEAFSGEDNPAWRGGVEPYYGPKFNEKLRSEIRSRDGHECQDCGLTAEQHKEKFGRTLEVHHIIPFRQFDDRDTAHEPDNLVTLCRSCHRKWEQIPGLRPA